MHAPWHEDVPGPTLFQVRNSAIKGVVPSELTISKIDVLKGSFFGILQRQMYKVFYIISHSTPHYTSSYCFCFFMNPTLLCLKYSFKF